MSPQYLEAQRLEQWTSQQPIPGFHPKTKTPMLVADSDRSVHAFSTQWLEEYGNKKVRAIVYNQWTLANGWTPPKDILVSPLKNQARILGAFLDTKGLMHLVFFGGDNTWAKIYYAKAPAISADRASSWSKPEMVGDKALDPQNGAIIGDDSGHLVIVFSGKKGGNGLYVVYSDNSGNSWSDPDIIYQTGDAELKPFGSKLHLGESGQVHSVWNVVNKAGHGESAYYSRLDISQRRWSNPIEVAKGVRLGAFNPNVIELRDDIIICYYNGKGNSNWWRLSSDNGQTWTTPERIAPNHIGFNGPVSLVVDSSDVLHLLFGGRILGRPATHGMWHAIWQDGRISEPEAVVSGPRVIDIEGGSGFDPSWAEAAIFQGNVLMVTWRTDPGAGKNGVWFSHKKLNAPELPPIPLPTPLKSD
jgi:hypothetical protein